MNLAAPTIRGTIKIHTAESPLRPIINWMNASAYKTAKVLAKKINTYIHTVPALVQINKTLNKTFI